MEGEIDAADSCCISEVKDEALLSVYSELSHEDEGLKQHIIDSYHSILKNKNDSQVQRNIHRKGSELVDRRAPLSYLKPKPKEKNLKKKDPALRNNPLQGRLIAMFCTTTVLLFVFFQSLLYNKIKYGYTYASTKQNSMYGPEPLTLYELGGLNANAILNDGQSFRLIWAAWMHSGWMHIILNVLCQAQYFFMIEPDWGSIRSFLLFFVSQISGNLLSVVADPCTTTVGSSGGLFGLLGATVPYTIEYWETIPNPFLILIFSIIVIVISFLMGFHGSTDNWAHLGGLFGGVLFGFLTLTSANVLRKFCKCIKKEKKKVIHRSAATNALRKYAVKECRCSMVELLIRFVAAAIMIVYFSTVIFELYNKTYKHPLGPMRFHGSSSCACCFYDFATKSPVKSESAKFYCFGEDTTFPSWTLTWDKFCKLTESEISAGGYTITEIDSIGRLVTSQ